MNPDITRIISRDKSYHRLKTVETIEVPVVKMLGPPLPAGQLKTLKTGSDKILYYSNGTEWVDLGAGMASEVITENTTVTAFNTVNTVKSPAETVTVTLAGTPEIGDVLTFRNTGPLPALIFDSTAGYTYILETTGSEIELFFNGDIWQVTSQTGVKYGFDELAYIPNPEPEANDFFGWTVSISADGSRMAVGAYLDNSPSVNTGSVYIYRREGVLWLQEAHIVNPYPMSIDFFGESVSLSADGSRIVIGARGDNPGDTGSIYIFRRNGTVWAEEQYIPNPNGGGLSDQFGRSVSISADGSRVITGADGTDSPPTGDSGAIYVYKRIGETWSPEVYIENPDPEDTDLFGFAVSISANGTRIAIGAARDKQGMISGGSLYIYRRNGDNWSQEAYIPNPDPQDTDFFGGSVSISADGSRIITGAYQYRSPGFSNGAVYIYHRNGSEWSQEAFIQKPDTSSFDNFGQSVYISADGNRVVVGVPGDDSPPSGDSGSIYIYKRIDSVWIEECNIHNPNPESAEYFGWSVSLSADGSRIVVGAYTDNSPIADAGSVYIF